MADNTYTGTLKFKDIDFVFVFDGSELVLIPPKERKHDIMWGWLKKRNWPWCVYIRRPFDCQCALS